jgi:hypothetical protein
MIATMQYRDVVATLRQPPNDLATDEQSSCDDENAHAQSPSRGPRLIRTA